MRRRKNRKGSVMVAVLCIFVLVAAFSLIIHSYALNNLQQAKVQEETMRAYYLAYSGCEMAYAALVKDSGGAWESYVSSFPNSGKEMNIRKDELSILDDNDSITINVVKEKGAGDFNNWLKISAKAISHENAKFSGEKTKLLYINPKDQQKIFWK